MRINDLKKHGLVLNQLSQIYKNELNEPTLSVPPGMPFAVIEGGIFGAKVVGHGIARRKPPAHLLDAGLASLGSGVC